VFLNQKDRLAAVSPKSDQEFSASVWMRSAKGSAVLAAASSRRFSASILPGVKPFFGDLACTVAISAVEPCDLRFSAPEFPIAATNRALHHVFVLLFLGLNHRLPLKAYRQH
jgi:hypothetical protein